MDPGVDAGRLLDKIDVLRHPSDLDLLMFFARHPRTILSSDQIAAFLGYGVKEIAASLELLLQAGFLTRTPNPRHAARMYLFIGTSPGGGGWLPALKRLATTREGRLALIWEIRRRSSNALGDPTARGALADTASGALQFPPRSAAVDRSQRQAPSTGAESESRTQRGRGGEQ